MMPQQELRLADPARQQLTDPLQMAGCQDACCPAPLSGTVDADWHRNTRRALALSFFSLAWMSAEGALGLRSGLHGHSVALVGWALGSVIEGLASVVVIWRFTGLRASSVVAERRAQRGVAVSFYLLAPYIAVQAVRGLVHGRDVHAGALGIAVTASSLLVMPVLGLVKRRVAVRLGSAATSGEATQNLLCAAQAGAVLLGLAVNAATGWSWVDPTIALLLAGWAAVEGHRAWRGDTCC